MAHLIIMDSIPAVLTYRDNSQVGGAGGSSGAHTHTLTFGPASADRALIALTTSNSTTNTTCTIAGITATLCIRSIDITPAFRTEIWIALVPSGTSGNVVMSGPSGNWRSSVGLYSATGLKSLTPTDTDGADDWNGSGFDGFVTTTVTVQGGGFLVSSLLATGSGVAPSSSWVGATQDYINMIQGSYAGASLIATTTHSATVTGAFGGLNSLVGATASFR